MAIDGDMRETFSVENDYSFQLRGDRFETVPLLETSEDPNRIFNRMRLAVPLSAGLSGLNLLAQSFGYDLRAGEEWSCQL